MKRAPWPALLPCPFCGAGEHRFDDRTHWTGTRSILLSVTLRHWCSITEAGGPRTTIVKVTRPTKLEAIEAWNTREAS